MVWIAAQVACSLALRQEYYRLPDLPSFAVFLSSEKDEGLVVANSDLRKYSVDSEFRYFAAVRSAGQWALPLDGVSFTPGASSSVNQPAVLDPAAHSILGPEAIISTLLADIRKNRSCTDSESTLICECSQRVSKAMYPTLQMTIASQAVTLSPYFYLQETEQGRCEVLISVSESGEWRVGRPLFREYFVEFNAEKGEVGLARSRNSVHFSPFSWTAVVASAACLLAAFLGSKMQQKDAKTDPLLAHDYLQLRIR